MSVVNDSCVGSKLEGHDGGFGVIQSSSAHNLDYHGKKDNGLGSAGKELDSTDKELTHKVDGTSSGDKTLGFNRERRGVV